MSCISAWCGYCLERHVRLIIWLHGNMENASELEKKEREIQYRKKHWIEYASSRWPSLLGIYKRMADLQNNTPKIQEGTKFHADVPPVWDQQQHVLIAEITGVTLERSRWKWVMLYTIHVEMWLNQKGNINSDKKWALDRISWVELITFPRWRTNPVVGELSITMLSSLIIVSQ